MEANEHVVLQHTKLVAWEATATFASSLRGGAIGIQQPSNGSWDVLIDGNDCSAMFYALRRGCDALVQND